MLRAQKPWMMPLLEKLQLWSLSKAQAEQGLTPWCERLRRAVPAIDDQYTGFAVDTPLLEAKLRGQHAFQIKLLLKAVERVAQRRSGTKLLTLVDIGDSSGTHLRYLAALLKEDPNLSVRSFETLSVNLDPVAVKKIKDKGFKALHCRAEELVQRHRVHADLFFTLETIEHLHDPAGFLNSLSKHGSADILAATVPYMALSRVGLHHIRQDRREPISPERTHIFELCPFDWKLLFAHAGWKVVEESLYRQYPRFSPASPVLREFWKRYDFEGFYGVILERDRAWADCYRDEPRANPPGP